MDNDIAKMTGQAGSEKVEAYKLNEVKMSGDDGAFSLREVLAGKQEDGKYRVLPLGETFEGVILKMRWRLTKYQEAPATSYMTSEFDNKNSDTVVEFSTKEKGVAADLKQKYALGSQRVLYVYDPKRKEIVRVIVKASGLSGKEGGAMGLFDYVDDFNKSQRMLHEYITTFKGEFREGKNADGSKNKRKDHFATTFMMGRVLTDSEKGRVIDMIKEVHGKTSAVSFAEAYNPEPEANAESNTGIQYPEDAINPDDIPF